MAALDAELKTVAGGRTATALANELELRTVADLLRHYPRRYAKRGELTDLASLSEGEHVTVLARVEQSVTKNVAPRGGRAGGGRRPRNLVEVTVTDGQGRLYLTFFNQQWRAKQLHAGVVGLFSGKVSTFKGKRQLSHPDCHLFDGTDTSLDQVEEIANAIIPVYPATAKLPSWKVQGSVQLVLGHLDVGADPLPEDVRRRQGLVGLADALRGIHQPADWTELGRARARLKWDEAFVLEVELSRRRRAQEALPAAPRKPVADGLLAAFDAALPFELTAGQQDVGDAILADIARSHPMHRLLQGEVGSGKTVCAVRAMLAVVDAGGQAALLAPTEVLAQQHYRSIVDLLGPLATAGQLGGDERGTGVELLTGSMGQRERRRVLLEAASGQAGIVVGTHALLQDQVQFADLGLVVVDEQHRFGVEQRDALRAKNTAPPHVLVMTATPIPRTVAMTVYGDLDVSTLRQLPAGRSAIASHVVPATEKPAHLARCWERIREEVGKGHQAYVVCPRIGDEKPGDADDAADEADLPQRPALAVLDVAPMLEEGPLSGLRLGVLHGRLPAEEKESVMRRFAAGEYDVLVATTVIEVGVDVPNATVMAVLDAERFGVAQLHQLRGRVGRGSAPGLCLLVTDAPADAPARERLAAVAGTVDGFELSRLDLAQRKEGTILSDRQHGRTDLKLLTLLHDEDIIKAARDEAIGLVRADPDLTEHPQLAKEIEALLGEDADYLEKG
ncbi:MAG: ATP-dependent DNA helicase RecG [Streptosporangiales bacterium]|nr:ATP-dependent DNA helicase RecG [Streptosporangiales bacterium]